MSEAQSRIKINKLLEQAGWRFFDDENGRANIALEPNVKIKQPDIDAFGEDFEKTTNGYIDFLLLDENGFPLAVLEAKKETKNPLDGKEQARKYAQSQNARFIILSNGNSHYFWDLQRGNPETITALPTYESLKSHGTAKRDLPALFDEQVDDDYIVKTQLPNYQKDPRWRDKAQRAGFIKQKRLKFLRDYQLKAVRALQAAAQEGKERHLFEMATGTGKTLVAAAVIKLFLRSGNAKRVLFLVDRIELENQARRSFNDCLRGDYACMVYKENISDWRKAEIVVSTVQSLEFNNKYQRLFSPTDFDLVISDEAHRSINGNARALFEYFVGYKLGLTATPRDYLKHIDMQKLNERDPRKWETRRLLDTYTTFGCESREPTFKYSLINGVKDGVLISPTVANVKTEVSAQLLSEKGYHLIRHTDDGDELEQSYKKEDYERAFFSENTNRRFCKTFLQNALRDPVSGEIGKTIIFCVSQKHASKITQILNELADERWRKNYYHSDFAVQVTSDISDAQAMSVRYTNNNLSGLTNWLEGYKSSRTRVCVTVGMMTTGYDCPDILNLCLMRPIFSPADFIQIKGRGTRKHTFSHKDGEGVETSAEKKTFKIFDFFENCAYFDKEYKYDQMLELPAMPAKTAGGAGAARGYEVREEARIFTPDPLQSITETAVGPEGMKIDRKFFERFERAVKKDPVAKIKYERGDIAGVEVRIRNAIFDRPKYYFSLAKLRQALKADRAVALTEIIAKVFGEIPNIKTKDELLEEEFQKFVAIHKPDSELALTIKNFLKAYITDEKVREIVARREYARFATNPKVKMDDFSKLNKWRKIIPQYVRDYVPLEEFK